MIVEGPDGREYGTAAAIGERLQQLGHANGPGLIRHWAHAGNLTPVGRQGRSPIYAVDDVMRVELETRKTKQTRGGPYRLTMACFHRTMMSADEVRPLPEPPE